MCAADAHSIDNHLTGSVAERAPLLCYLKGVRQWSGSSDAVGHRRSALWLAVAAGTADAADEWRCVCEYLLETRRALVVVIEFPLVGAVRTNTNPEHVRSAAVIVCPSAAVAVVHLIDCADGEAVERTVSRLLRHAISAKRNRENDGDRTSLSATRAAVNELPSPSTVRSPFGWCAYSAGNGRSNSEMPSAQAGLEALIAHAQLQQTERGGTRSADTWLEYGRWYTAAATAKVHASIAATAHHAEPRAPNSKRTNATGLGADVEAAVGALYAQSVEAEEPLSEFVKQVRIGR